jgi:NADH dehydrogenase
VRVSSDLSLPGHPEIFVIGDLAYYEQDGRPLPGVAPVAMQQGRHVARVIRDRLRGRTTAPFRYSDRGMLAIIGRNAGVGTLGRVKLTGRIAWLVWLSIHLFFLTEAFSRLLVFLKWGYNYVTYDRGSRLITGK